MIKQQEPLQKSFQSDFAAVSKKLDSNHAALRTQNTAVLQGLNDLAAKIVVLETQQLDNYDNFKQVMASASSDVFKRLSELNSKLDGFMEERQIPNARSSSAEIGLAVRPREQQYLSAISDGQIGEYTTASSSRGSKFDLTLESRQAARRTGIARRSSGACEQKSFEVALG